MTINDGVLYWKSDSINAEQYDVRLVVSDGFERDVQEFQLLDLESEFYQKRQQWPLLGRSIIMM